MKLDRYLVDVAQNVKEIDWLIDLFKREKIKSFLEIGARYGGSLWKIATTMPKGSKVVCVDLPDGYGGRPDGQVNLEACINKLNELGYDAHLFLEDSTDEIVVNEVKLLAPFDACFIDANHIERFVRADWANYGPLCRIVAFHDIGWKRDRFYAGTRIDVPVVWNELKLKYRHEEMILDKKDNGIGVLWKS
jgi:Methyltransferase domain